MRESFRLFLCVLGVALAAFWLSAPATAWSVHKTAHIASPVAETEHHHHSDSGQFDAAGETADDEDGDKGHDHLPSLCVSLAATVDGAPALALPVRRILLPGTSLQSGLAGLTQPPPARPPRSS